MVSFEHPSEHLGQNLASRSIPLRSGTNPIQIVIPPNVGPGDLYARFRISTAGNLAPLGAASDGEVEDYRWQMQATSPTTVATFQGGLLAGDERTLDLTVQRDQEQYRVLTDDHILYTSPAGTLLSVTGSDQDDRVRVESLEDFIDGSVRLDLGAGDDVVDFANQGTFDAGTLVFNALRGVDGLGFRQSRVNTVFLDAAGLTMASVEENQFRIEVDLHDSVTFVGDWEASAVVMRNDGPWHRTQSGDLVLELRDDRPWTNPVSRFDVGRDNQVTALDALQIINRLGDFDSTPALPDRTAQNLDLGYYDTSVDGRLSALDALLVINALNSGSLIRGNSLAEGHAEVANPTNSEPVQVFSNASPPPPVHLGDADDEYGESRLNEGGTGHLF